MAASVFQDFLTCPVCFETFTEPVSLGCIHSFCLECIQNFWQQNPSRNCPVCRRKSSKESAVVNFALKELSVSFKQKCDEEEAVECRRHPEEIRLFCLDDGRLLCPICEFSRHARHAVVERDQVAAELKKKIQWELKTLRQEKDIVGKVEKSYVELKRHSLRQVEESERQIRAELNRFYQFLKKEEERSVEELKEEYKRKDEAIKEEMDGVQTLLLALNESISNMEDQLSSIDQNFQPEQAKKYLDFLKENGKSNPQVQTQEFEKVLPKIGTGLLINQAEIVGNLGFRIWEKVRTLVAYSPVILEPNTAHASLRLSDDLTKVRFAESQTKSLPNNPERFTNEEIVLGAEGFDAGVHSWVVEVGDYPRWDVGVVKASVDRRGEIFADEESGIWCLWCGGGVYNDGDSRHVIELKKRPERIRITLDFDQGFLSFYDAEDSTHLYTHRYAFAEKLFPYISIGPEVGIKTKEVKICAKTFT